MKRKAIYLDANADLATALSKLDQNGGDEIVLVIPKGSVLFNNVVNLKILKSNIQQQNKFLALVTLDPMGRAIAKQIGLKVYKTLTSEDEIIMVDENDSNNLETSKTKPPSNETDAEPELKSEAQPSTSDELTPPSIRPERKIKYQRRQPKSNLYKSIQEVSADAIVVPTSKSSTNRSKNKLMFVFVLVAFLVLGGVVYFILPRATVNLDIKAEPFIHQFRLVLADEEDLNAAGQNVFKGRFVEVTQELIQTFSATGFKNKGNPASGFIIIYNYTQTMKGLISETRFVSSDGLVFRIKEEVLIAPASTSSSGSLIPGRTKAKVIADTGGTDGNLALSNKFTVPGLGSVGVDLVFGKNDDPFTGGTDDKVKVVSQEDIESARESISKNVFLDTELQLQELVKKNEELIVPLIQNDIVDSVPSVAVGAKREAFDLKIQVRSWTLLPDSGQLENIINNTVNTIIPADQTITSQTLKSARVVIDNTDFLMHIIDFAVEIDGLIASKLNKAEIAGSISNRSSKSTTQLLDSMPEVISHKIVLWPFWVKRLPILENNIKIIVSYIN